MALGVGIARNKLSRNQLNNWVLESMDEGKVTGLLFVDISKAFDSLNHKVLLRKLNHLGVSERSLRWFRSYLADRQQRELINGELSERHSITLDVPQGSILGPLLFNVYINNLPNAVKKTRMILYADDAVLFYDASTREELQTTLEREFTEISNWYTDNRLTINVKKTKLMLAGSKRMLSLFEDFELKPNGTQIDRVQSFKYLGVTTDAKWSWKPHISNLLKKLGHRLSLFNRIFHMLDNSHSLLQWASAATSRLCRHSVGRSTRSKVRNGKIAKFSEQICKEN